MPSITWYRIETMIPSTLGSPAMGLIIFSLIIVYCTASVTADYSLYDFQCFRGDEPDHSQSFLKEKFKGIIGLQVSPRTTHQLISRIFSIFLREILGYKNIALVDLEFHQNETREQFKLYKTLESLAARSGTWPIPVIDLEVWMYPDYHALPTEISEAGLVTNPGRFGWFVPQQLLDTDLNNTQLVQMLHYTALQDPSNEYYDNFVVDDNVLNILEDKFGIERRFIPEHCNQSLPKNRCITIFSEYYSDTAFAEKHINELHFYTNILWIGKNYTNAVAWLFDHYKNEYKKIKKKKFILLHWTPSNIIDAEINFESITMPRCETIEGDDESLCKYELTPLLKYYNSAVQFRGIFKAFYALEAFQIHGNELKKLLIETNRATANSTRTKSHVYDEVACNWLKNTKVDNYTNVYKKWILTTSGDITIGGIFPITENNEAYRGITLAAEQAANAVKRSKILPGYKITLQNNDGKCRSDTAMKAFIHCSYILTPLIGVLGPACSEAAEPIAGISKYLGMVVISYAAEGSTFTDRQSYPYFFRTIGSNRQYEIVYLKLLQQLKWRRIAALTEDGQKYTEYISHMENLLKQNNMELVINKKFPKDISVVEMKSHLLDLKKKNAKIIIADVNNENAQLVICEAHHLKMTAEHGYVWFLPFWLSKRWVNETYPNGKHPNCTFENYKKVINGHFALNHAPFASNVSIMQENKTVGQWLQEYTQTRGYISNYAGFAYDAVWVYALAASKLLKEDPSALYDLRDTHVLNKLIDIIWKTDFQGVSGRIRFDDGGSRISDINIMQWINGSYHQIGKYTPEIQEKDYTITGGSLELNENLIVWLSRNGKPKDGTFVCGMASLAEYLKTDCENVTFILITTMCLAVVILVSLASFMFWKRQYNRKLKHSAKVMRNFGIDLLSPSMSKNNTLDKWEVPKENVVINRRLGEGAFGTVYGGEAQFTEGEWTAVAVKTLKMGASTEDRLDFLSEAEAMKRFDHKNIVKLLGVCLQTEPIYTIMEFMLYGDLKTFLLARRHLVNEKLTDDSDISSKRLTMMALDIARGLSYLADQKYVHRDMACRNCLVNAQRVVKLGDFGMARPMFDNDYYRFNRKGMLPVRWMAPESLGLGLFTPSSDVWSFGILLYEIITFGSFPYQGLTNNQVLDHIKNGKTLQIPVGVKPHLDGLMRACWNIEYKKRPTASEIVEYISNYPRLLSPCLDVPLSSVQIPETESDQLELLPGLRRRNKTQPNLDILARASNINNFDQKCDNERSESSTYENNMNIDVLNVPPDSVSNDEITINAYSPMSPLLKISNEVTKSNLSLKRYVPMYSSTTKPNQDFDSNSTIRLESPTNTEF